MRLSLVVALLLACAAPLTAADASPQSRVEAQALAWKRLAFKARKLIFKAHTEVRVARRDAGRVAAEWAESPRGRGLWPTGADVLEVTLDSEMAGRASTESVFFDPKSGFVFERLKIRHGKKGYRKQTRFTEEGAFVLRRAPAKRDEVGEPFERWTKIEKFFHPYSLAGCAKVAEPAMLFHVLGTATLPTRICVWSEERWTEVEIAVVGKERVEAAYGEITAAGATRRHEGETEAWKVVLRPLAEDADFEFLGLSGEIEIFLEPAKRVPLRIEGRLSGLGRVTVKLEEVELADLTRSSGATR